MHVVHLFFHIEMKFTCI